MIRKLLLPLVFISLLSPSFGEAFLSNALGQNLGTIPALTGAGYEGESDGAETVIYHDGDVIRRRTVTDRGYITEYGDTRETVSLGEEGERTEWRLETPDGEEVHTYFYEDGRLSSVSVSVNGELLRRLVYLDTPKGSLSAITGSSDAYISPSFYLYEADGKSVRFSYHENGIVTRENLSDKAASYEAEEDGSWRETSTLSDGSIMERLYSPDGKLAEERVGESVTKYEYDDGGDLVLAVTVNGEEEIREHYSEGSLVLTEILSGGVMEKERHVLESGDIEEIRYRDGKAEYSILFDGDGVRVKEIHRL